MRISLSIGEAMHTPSGEVKYPLYLVNKDESIGPRSTFIDEHDYNRLKQILEDTYLTYFQNSLNK